MQTEKSHLDIYAERKIFGRYLLAYNHANFCVKFEMKKDQISFRKTPVIVRLIPNFSFNRDGN